MSQTVVIKGNRYGLTVYLDPQATVDVVCACLNKSESDILIWEPKLALDIDQIRTRCKNITQTFRMAEDNTPEACGSILSAYEGREPDNTIDEKSCAAIIFTSGTTGEEKGVMLSHANLIDTTFNGNFDVNIKISILPMHHAFSVKSDFLTPLGVGSTICFHNGMDKLGEALQAYEPTCLSMVPMIANALYNKVFMFSQQTGKTMEECKYLVFGKRINQIITGGAHLPSELVDKYQNIGILIGQGKTMQEAMDEVQMVVEGVYSAKAAIKLAEKYGVSMPIIEQVNQVLFEDKSAAEAVKELMLREGRAELSSLTWDN